MKIATEALRTRFRGCLLGGAMGDALGAGIEFQYDRNRIAQEFGPYGIRDYVPTPYGKDLGLITDDTQMHLFTVEALIQALRTQEHPTNTPSAIARRFRDVYLRWYGTQLRGRPPEPAGGLLDVDELYNQRAPGNTCLSSLRQLSGRDRDVWYVTNHSKGCGGVMRSAACGLAFADPDSAWTAGWMSAQVTHGHIDAQAPSAALAWIVARIVHGGLGISEAIQGVAQWMKDGKVSTNHTLELLQKAVSRSKRTPSDPRHQAAWHEETLDKFLGEGWTGDEALAIAAYACLVFEGNAEEAIVLAVNHGGDSDSTGAIAGNIMGATLGEKGLPARWLANLELCELIVSMADELLSAYKS